MRRQRNLQLLPTSTRVKAPSIAFPNGHLPSTSRNFGHGPSKLPIAGPSRPKTSFVGPKLRNLQNTSCFATKAGVSNSDESVTRREKGSRHAQENDSPKQLQDQVVKPILVRHGFPGSYHKDVKARTVVLTPWRGAPTLLHALGFLRELEDKYGKIWWAGLTKERANPYEYNTNILVIFEDPASLTRIPGFSSFSFQPQTSPIVQSTGTQSSLAPGTVDLGPSSSLDPLSNPDSQALLKRVEANAQRQNTSPLFVPWSESLTLAAHRKGGPALEDVLPFLDTKKNQGEDKSSVEGQEQLDSESSPDDLSNEVTKQQPATFKKASWEEHDEPVNIDAVVKKFSSERLFLPSPPGSLSHTYFKPQTRLSVARALVDFGGFAETPVPSMQTSIKVWQKELDIWRSNTWAPWSESNVDDLDVKDGQDAITSQDLEEELPWDDFSPGVWPIVNAGSSQVQTREGEDLVPKQQTYQRIAVENELDDVEEWEGTGSHPLQFPRTDRLDGKAPVEEAPAINLVETVRSRLASLPAELERLAQTESPTGRLGDTSAALSDAKKVDDDNAHQISPETKGTRLRDSENLRDPWRTDPRPFRSGLGRDEPTSSYSPVDKLESVASERARWSKPGLDTTSSGARERGAMANGRHSMKSDGWGKDRRGKKLRSREEVETLKEFGLGNLDELAEYQMKRLRSARTRGELGRIETWQAKWQADGNDQGVEESAARISAIAGKEQRKKEVKNLKDRLRAILDGTNVD